MGERFLPLNAVGRHGCCHPLENFFETVLSGVEEPAAEALTDVFLAVDSLDAAARRDHTEPARDTSRHSLAEVVGVWIPLSSPRAIPADHPTPSPPAGDPHSRRHRADRLTGERSESR
jgi:hypothetical protein